MTERFEELEAEYDRLAATLPARLKAAKSRDGDASTELRNIENDIGVARKLLNDMEMEARGMDRAIKRSFTDRIRKHRSTLSGFASDLGRAQQRASRSALVGGGDLELAETSMGNRARLLEVGDRMDRTTATLAESRRTLEETTEVAAGITVELARNRETIESSHRKVRETRSMLGNARRLLVRMSRREVQIKLMYAFLILMMLGVIILVVYYAFFHSPSDTPPETDDAVRRARRLSLRGVMEAVGLAAAEADA
mmetsp:Transcript_21984/g.51634  ORF Transcript_21984/g.51634 Transcript_21984/m.51634 type:complete len:254 (-) Transcript_21984:139-900(-)